MRMYADDDWEEDYCEGLSEDECECDEDTDSDEDDEGVC